MKKNMLIKVVLITTFMVCGCHGDTENELNTNNSVVVVGANKNNESILSKEKKNVNLFEKEYLIIVNGGIVGKYINNIFIPSKDFSNNIV
jgi:hypothetical protein